MLLFSRNSFLILKSNNVNFSIDASLSLTLYLFVGKEFHGGFRSNFYYVDAISSPQRTIAALLNHLRESRPDSEPLTTTTTLNLTNKQINKYGKNMIIRKLTCKRILSLSNGAVDVLDTAPAPAPATSCFHHRPDVFSSSRKSSGIRRLSPMSIAYRNINCSLDDERKVNILISTHRRVSPIPKHLSQVVSRFEQVILPPFIPRDSERTVFIHAKTIARTLNRSDQSDAFNYCLSNFSTSASLTFKPSRPSALVISARSRRPTSPAVNLLCNPLS